MIDNSGEGLMPPQIFEVTKKEEKYEVK